MLNFVTKTFLKMPNSNQTALISSLPRKGRVAQTGSDKVLNMISLNPAIKDVAYAVRGALAIRAEELKSVGHPKWHTNK
jgi:hypothetical protein